MDRFWSWEWFLQTIKSVNARQRGRGEKTCVVVTVVCPYEIYLKNRSKRPCYLSARDIYATWTISKVPPNKDPKRRETKWKPIWLYASLKVYQIPLGTEPRKKQTWRFQKKKFKLGNNWPKLQRCRARLWPSFHSLAPMPAALHPASLSSLHRFASGLLAPRTALPRRLLPPAPQTGHTSQLARLAQVGVQANRQHHRLPGLLQLPSAATRWRNNPVTAET